MKNLLLATLLTILITGCDATAEKETATQVQPPAEEIKPAEQQSKEVTMKGTVRFLNLEGGFYGVITKDGRKLLPMNLDKDHMQDGAIIEFTGEIQKGVMTIQQWGTPFKFEKVKLLKAGRKVMNQDLN